MFLYWLYLFGPPVKDCQGCKFCIFPRGEFLFPWCLVGLANYVKHYLIPTANFWEGPHPSPTCTKALSSTITPGLICFQICMLLLTDSQSFAFTWFHRYPYHPTANNHFVTSPRTEYNSVTRNVWFMQTMKFINHSLI